MKELERRVTAIEKRNRTVELDKAWETSWTRRLSVFGLIYVIIGLYFALIIHLYQPWLNAFVPAIGFMFGSSSLKLIQSVWIKRRSKN